MPNKIFSSVFWVYLENTSSQLISFVVTVILARLLEPSHYGTIALLTVFIALAQVFVTNGISSALIQKKDADELDYSSMFWFNLLASLLLYALLYFAAPFIADYYNQEELTIVLRILALSIPLSAYNCIQQAYVSSKMIFKKSFISNAGGGFFSGFIAVIMAYLNCGLWALVTQRILHIAFNTFFLMLVVEWRPKVCFSFLRLKPLLSFGWRIMTTSFMFTAYAQLRSLIIGKRYSAADLGYYDRGYSFPSLIAGNIDSTITRVLFPALAHVQKESNSLSEKTRKAAKTSAFIMTPILWGLAVMAQPVVQLLIGEKWLPCVPYLQIMCFVWWLQPTQTCSAQAIKAIGRSDLFLYNEIISKIIGLILLALAIFVFDSVFAIAIMFLIGQIIAVFIYGFCSQRYIGYKVKFQLYDIFVPAWMSLVMCTCIKGVELCVSNLLLCMVLQCVAGVLVYLLLSIITHNETYSFLLNSLNFKKK